MKSLFLVGILPALENSAIAETIRQSSWFYPILEIVHIVGIVLLVGPALMFDLRLLGFSKKIPVPDLAGYLLPWSRSALWLVIPSGVLLFITNATSLSGDPTFWIKIFLLLSAGLNATTFHRFTSKKFEKPGLNRLPAGAKAAALLSITIWLAVIACGRLLAY